MRELARLVVVDYWHKASTLAKLRGQRVAVSLEQAQDRLAKDAEAYIARCESHGVNPLHNTERVMQRAVLLGHIKLPLLSVLGVTPDGADSFRDELRAMVKERITADLVKVTGASENLRVMFGDVAWNDAMVTQTLRGMLNDPVVSASYCGLMTDTVSDLAKISFLQAPDVYSEMLSGVLHAVFSNLVTEDV